MAEPAARYCRSLVSFSASEIDQLLTEARKKGLKLATYLRSVVIENLQKNQDAPRPRKMERAGGAVNR